MADSESDNAFESADEGEDSQSIQDVCILSNKTAEIVLQEKSHSVSTGLEKNCETEKFSFNDYGEKTLPASYESENNTTTENQKESGNNQDVTTNKFLNSQLPSTLLLENVAEEQKMPQKRVVLRLEKKLQEKAHRNIEQKTILSDSPIEREQESQQSNQGSWKWGDWGSSLFSTAASSVSTFTSQVSQGFGTVLETVEATLGAPSPEELATATVNRQNTSKEVEKANDRLSTSSSEQEPSSQKPPVVGDPGSGGGLLSSVSSVTKVLETTGSKVIHGGLDTLELIGKKTFDILTEGDPGLRKKRSIFTGGDTSLSQILREAKEKPEISQDFQTNEEQRTADYRKFFDDFQGLIHLEALEMLSGESRSKLHGELLNSSEPLLVKDKLDKIQQMCEDLVPEDDTPDEERDQDFFSLMSEHVAALHLSLNIGKLMEVQQNAQDWLKECKISQDNREIKDPQDIHHQALSTLAEFTSKCIEQFHKIAELLLVKEPDSCSPDTLALHLAGLATVLCIEVSILSTRFCQCLNTAADDSEDPDAVIPFITNVYLEASNSNTYIQDAFLHLVPVLQLVTMQSLTPKNNF